MTRALCLHVFSVNVDDLRDLPGSVVRPCHSIQIHTCNHEATGVRSRGTARVTRGTAGVAPAARRWDSAHCIQRCHGRPYHDQPDRHPARTSWSNPCTHTPWPPWFSCTCMRSGQPRMRAIPETAAAPPSDGRYVCYFIHTIGAVDLNVRRGWGRLQRRTSAEMDELFLDVAAMMDNVGTHAHGAFTTPLTAGRRVAGQRRRPCSGRRARRPGPAPVAKHALCHREPQRDYCAPEQRHGNACPTTPAASPDLSLCAMGAQDPRIHALAVQGVVETFDLLARVRVRGRPMQTWWLTTKVGRCGTKRSRRRLGRGQCRRCSTPFLGSSRRPTCPSPWHTHSCGHPYARLTLRLSGCVLAVSMQLGVR
jgi:hypothetical protein